MNFNSPIKLPIPNSYTTPCKEFEDNEHTPSSQKFAQLCTSSEYQWKSPISKKSKSECPDSKNKNLSSNGDRFIPLRTDEKSKLKFCLSTNDQMEIESFNSESQNSYSCHLQKQLFPEQNNILKFKQTQSIENQENLISINKQLFQPKSKLSCTAFKVLDAPGLLDDFYCDLLHWGINGYIAIVLQKQLYFYNPSTQNIVKPNDNQNEQISAVQWSKFSNYLIYGTSDGNVITYNFEKNQIDKNEQVSDRRIGCISFSNDHVYAYGSKEKSLFLADNRMSNSEIIKIQNAHSQEICGLDFSADETTLVSGGNDNKVCIWSIKKMNQPLFKIHDHKAAVRAVAFSKQNCNILATGGGIYDKTIRLWNISNQVNLSTTNVDSQVCKIHFSPHSNQLLSTHGYEKNQLAIWEFNSQGIKLQQTLEGHQQRVLYLSLSPDQTVACSGAGDETLKFWKVFQQNQKMQQSQLNIKSDIR